MSLNNKRVLVVGGAGFIGSHVVSELLRTNVNQIIIFDNFSRGKHLNIKKSIKDKRCAVYPNGGDIEILMY